jgi:ribosomal protein S27E
MALQRQPPFIHMSSTSSNWPLSTCGTCGSHLVHPTGGRETPSAVWEVDLRCPDCGQRWASYYTQAELDRLERELDGAASEIEKELSRLEALHMEEWVARFESVLNLDLIVPDDF